MEARRRINFCNLSLYAIKKQLHTTFFSYIGQVAKDIFSFNNSSIPNLNSSFLMLTTFPFILSHLFPFFMLNQLHFHNYHFKCQKEGGIKKRYCIVSIHLFVYTILYNFTWCVKLYMFSYVIYIHTFLVFHDT